MSEFIEEMPLYQAGFQPNRSTDDHVYTAKSILDERCRKGKVTYVLSLDLKQAFDRLKLEPITAILKFKGVPHYLINRIVSACLSESTIVYYGLAERLKA